MPETKPRRTRQQPPQPPVHVRSRGDDSPRGMRELPDDFNALAQGERPRRAPPKPQLRDDRAEALVPAVANRDARAVCDARIERMVAARDEGDLEALGRDLAEAFRLGLWRGRNLMGFDALIEDVLGLRVAEGRRLAEEGAKALGTRLARADDRIVATWFRAEAALVANPSACRVELHGDGDESRFVITLDAERADLWIAEMGKRVVAMSKFLPPPSAPRKPGPRR